MPLRSPTKTANKMVTILCVAASMIIGAMFLMHVRALGPYDDLLAIIAVVSMPIGCLLALTVAVIDSKRSQDPQGFNVIVDSNGRANANVAHDE